MTNEEYGNEPIAPTVPENWHNKNHQTEGLTKREYFASLALRGLCSSGIIDIQYPAADRISGMAVAYADVLIAELNKPIQDENTSDEDTDFDSI